MCHLPALSTRIEVADIGRSAETSQHTCMLAQAELIGAERDGKRDEKMRAKLHAAWLEQQDTARVEALLHGVKNGFRKKRSALDDEASAAAPKNVSQDV